jgi:hypothetical protein
MTPADYALRRMHAGTPPGLAIWQAARRYGVDTRAVVAGIPRKRKRPAVPAVVWWWNKPE